MAIIISYPTSASGIIVLLKTPPKYRKLDYNKNKKAQKITHTLAIFVDISWYNGSYTMMAKPIKTLELHYPMIQFLIKPDIPTLSWHIQTLNAACLRFAGFIADGRKGTPMEWEEANICLTPVLQFTQSGWRVILFFALRINRCVPNHV